MSREGCGAPTRCGFVAIVGAPNVGKSTLQNRLVGTKVSIVSPKVQTTRRRVLGITTQGASQVVFVDTPGIFAPREGRRLEMAMVRTAWQGAEDADLRLLVVDAKRGLDRETQIVLDGMRERREQAWCVINKLDVVSPPRLLPLIKAMDETGLVERVFIVSAATGDGCDDLLTALATTMPPSPWLFPEDQLSDLSNRVLAAEITREKLFIQLHEELPYSLTVETEGWTEAPPAPSGAESDVRIDQTIYVQRESQKAIVLGERGRRIRAVGQAARLELEEILERRVHLFLYVKVRERWLDDPERLHAMGLDPAR